MQAVTKNNRIVLTHGDTLKLELKLLQDGKDYEPEAGDVIRFALSIGYVGDSSYQLILTKTIPIDTMVLTLTSEETAALSCRTYNYDMQITHVVDGSVDTFISGTMTITKEVA